MTMNLLPATVASAESLSIEEWFMLLTVFVLAIMVGVELISKGPPLLHTPLMSGSNAISGISLVGAVYIASVASTTVSLVLTFVAVLFATINVVGGYAVTNRMLQMFKKKK